MRKPLGFALLLPAVVVGLFFSLPTLLDWQLNSPLAQPPYPARQSAKNLYRTLFVADLHNDQLLWQRDLLERSEQGQSDLPRLLEGGVALQVFSTVTKIPPGMNNEHTADNGDALTLLLMAQRWPRSTWGSLLQRALYQSERLQQAIAGSNGRLHLIRTQADLRRFIAMREGDSHQVAALLATEGLQPLEGRLENIDRLYDAGFRIAGLTHFFDNEVGGSAHGMEKGGLTPFGEQVIERLQSRGVLIDLAHASPALIRDVLLRARRPVLVSHTGVAGTCPGTRNLDDEQLRSVAATGGLVGIGYWAAATCDTSPLAIARAIRHASDIIGVDHVALGSDFNGAVHTPFDTTGLAQLVASLQDQGFDDRDIAAIMGGNVRRLLLQTLPES